MKNPLLGLLVAILTFSFGFLIQNLLQPRLITYKYSSVQSISVAKEELNVNINKNTETEFSIKDSFDKGFFNSVKSNRTYLFLYSSLEREKISIYGGLKIDSRKYEIVQLNENMLGLNTKRISFKTEQIENVQYKFDGKFIKKNFKDGETVLGGKLQKIVKGEIVEKMKDSYIFYYYLPNSIPIK